MGRSVKIIDITRPLSEDCLTYPGDISPVFRQADHGNYLITDLHMSTHTGTHVDAPVHYLKMGDTIDTIPLSQIIGTCRVLDVTRSGTRIAANDLIGRLDGIERLLLKTSFSGTESFDENYPSLTEDAALLITSLEMKCVGIDSPSIESFGGEGNVHCELLGHGCIIIELLDLTEVEEGDYTMIALPLRLTGLDGSPARVVLIDNNGCE
ncbi:MAG TPA: cyclase family protein [Methanoregula sp.]|nr:cyclase family protein [Methanoregula sp.]